MSILGHRWIVCLPLSVVVGAAAFSPREAWAGDSKRLPGMACQFESNNGFVAHDRLNGRFQNNGAGGHSVICPILEDDLGTARMRVFVRSDDDVVPSSCRVIQRTGGDDQGNPLFFTTHVHQNTTPFPESDTLDINWSTPINGGGNFSVRCNLRAGESIYFVQSDEE